MAGHTVKAYDRELDAIGRAIVEMGRLAVTMVGDAAASLAGADVDLALAVAATGERVAQMQHRVESEAVLTIVRRSPVAVDLRDVVAAIRIAGDLGRIAAHAEKIASQTVKIGFAPRVPRAIVGVRHMGALAIELVQSALDAYAERDAERARAVWERDADLDSLEGSVFGDLLSEMLADPRAISFCARIMTVSKNFERIGDHATNIAETTVYLVTGVAMTDERPRGRGTAAIDPVADADDF